MIFLYVYIAGFAISLAWLVAITMQREDFITINNCLVIFAISLLSWVVVITGIIVKIKESEILDKVVWRKETK